MIDTLRTEVGLLRRELETSGWQQLEAALRDVRPDALAVSPTESADGSQPDVDCPRSDVVRAASEWLEGSLARSAGDEAEDVRSNVPEAADGSLMAQLRGLWTWTDADTMGADQSRPDVERPRGSRRQGGASTDASWHDCADEDAHGRVPSASGEGGARGARAAAGKVAYFALVVVAA